MGRSYKFLFLEGDGIGKEIMPVAFKVFDILTNTFGIECQSFYIECGYEYWLKNGNRTRVASPELTWELIRGVDGIIKGPTGEPVTEDLSKYAREISLTEGFNLQEELDLFANIRPVKLRNGVSSRLTGGLAGKVDFLIIGENREGKYAPIKGSLKRGKQREIAVDVSVATREGCRRIMELAFQYARRRKGSPLDGKHRVTCVGKFGEMRVDDFMREMFDNIAHRYPEIEKDYSHVDAFAYNTLVSPSFYDVCVMENQYRDILSSMAAAIQGSAGLSPSLCVGENHAYAQAIHGTAPDIAGKGISNPIGLILSVGLLLDWVAERVGDGRLLAASEALERSVDRILASREYSTPDMGGASTTAEVVKVLDREIRASGNQERVSGGAK